MELPQPLGGADSTLLRVARPPLRLSRWRAARAEGTAPTTATARRGRNHASHNALRQGHTRHRYHAPGQGSGPRRSRRGGTGARRMGAPWPELTR
jgi:hypothetical protein